MTLTTRLSLFFLGALAVVLLGFSAALYLLARTYLDRQVEERLAAALDTLAAAAEVGPDGVEWEPHERQLALGREAGTDRVRWEVRDERGRLVDQSPGPGPGAADGPADEEVLWQGQPWRLARRRVVPTRTAAAPTPGPPERKYQALVLTAGLSLEPAATTLRTLALVLGGLSAGLWLVAALVGRRLCRRALAPVTRMAAAARTIHADDLGRRLPAPGTRDELDELGRAFNDLLDRLQESFERQRRFTGEASHQLRTPLAALLGQVEVAQRRERAPEEYRRVLASVRDRAVHLRQIVEMLLFLARADAESQSPGLEPLDLGEWLPRHLRAWAEHPRAADLRPEPAGGPLPVRAHPALLGQALDNLLDNACKYSPPGSPVCVRAGQDGGAVTLAVEDRGGGIAAEDVPRLFEPFYRARGAREGGVAGAGLGLAVAARIVAAFGGEIAVASTPGEGSRFTIRLPAVAG